jgi:uncharacterized protein
MPYRAGGGTRREAAGFLFTDMQPAGAALPPPEPPDMSDPTMSRKRFWEIGATSALLLAVGVVLAGFFTWRERQKALTAALNAALDREDVQAAKKLSLGGADVDSAGTGGEGFTPLMIAAGEGDEGWVEALLRAGARVDTRFQQDETALMLASGYLSRVPRWRDFGGSFLHQPDSRYPARAAAYARIAALLIDHGAAVNAADRERRTSLMWAAEAGNGALVKLLLDRGAQVDARDHERKTALVYAVEGFLDAAVVDTLLEHGADPNVRDQHGRTLLMAAADDGKVDAARVFLSRGGELLETDSNGATALSYAARSDHPEMVRFLVKAGIPVNHRDRADITPLMQAESWGATKAARALLALGADGRLRDESGMTAQDHAGG